MPSLRTLAAGFLAVLTGCQARKTEPATASPGPQLVAPKPAVDTSRVAVFSYDEERDHHLFQNAIQVKATSLSPAEVAQVETLLRACIDEYNQPQVAALQKLRNSQPKQVFKADNFIINLPRYKRQLVAVINAKGEKEVWVNCFNHEVYNMDWHHEIAFWHDGGNCLFNVKINLAKHKWYDLMVNDWT